MADDGTPLVSIGMTVYNAERFIAKALESILDQDFSDFELIISDDASTDGSSEIIRSYAARDKRIFYHRNRRNLGPVRNMCKVVDLCWGKYMMFMDDHDVYDPRYISSMLGILEQDESVVMAYSQTVYIDAHDNFIELLPDRIDTRGGDICQRFKTVIWELTLCNMMYGLFRKEALNKAWSAYEVIGPDHVFLAAVSMHGAVAQVNEPLFYRRQNRPAEDERETTKRYTELFVKSHFESIIPWTMMAYEHVRLVHQSELAAGNKEMLLEEIRRCFPTRFGYHMHQEARKLVQMRPEIYANVEQFPDTRQIVINEIDRLLAICRFFYPDMSELHAMTTHGNLAGSGAGAVRNRPGPPDLSPGPNNKNGALVSVVIPTHNRAYILPRAINSVLGQTYPIHEIIIVDDGSSDDTAAVVRQYQEDMPQVKYFRVSKSGAQAARNEGIRQATGTWIAFLDSDDAYLPEKIEKQMSVAQSEKVSVVHCECIVKHGDQPPELFGTPALHGNIYKAVLSSPGPTFPALLVRKKALEAIGLLDPSVPSFQEWDTVIRLAKDFEFGYVPEPLYLYYCHEGETISKDMKRHAKGYAYIVEKHAIDMLRYGGRDVLVAHYRSLIQQAMDYDLPIMLQIYKYKFKALNSAADISLKANTSSHNAPALSYISASETVSAAEHEGLSVCDYVEKLWGQKGDTQRVIDQMVSCGVFAISNPKILEIGTGTGRYLEKVYENCKPAKYESYETAEDWAEWLQSHYPIISHRADGMTLSQTPSHSVDILHAHGVFVYLPFLVSYRYWKEIWRVVRRGGFVVFDIYSEDCLDEEAVENWLTSQHNYPCFLSRNYIVSIFGKHGFSILKTFKNRHGAGHSEYLVFYKG